MLKPGCGEVDEARTHNYLLLNDRLQPERRSRPPTFRSALGRKTPGRFMRWQQARSGTKGEESRWGRCPKLPLPAQDSPQQSPQTPAACVANGRQAKCRTRNGPEPGHRPGAENRFKGRSQASVLSLQAGSEVHLRRGTPFGAPFRIIQPTPLLINFPT